MRWFINMAAILCALATMLSSASAANWSDYYEIENIDGPDGVVAEVGGIDVLDDGRLVFAFNRGEVYLYEPQSEQWSRFAEGLHNPLGVHARSASEIYVAQYPEITLLRDTTGDGVADHYQTINNQFGMSGNYHEFHFGLAADEHGNLYSGLNVASHGAGVRFETRGDINPDGRPGRMFSAVPYRGWVIKTTPEGEMVPYASGFRSPNGLLFDSQGRLFVTDNEGDWIGTSPLYHVQRGNFYGHVLSLVWEDDWDKGIAIEYDPQYYDDRRTLSAVDFTHGFLSNSPSEPVEDTTNGTFGPFTGQIFVGELNHPHLIRVMPDEVAGHVQGAAVRFHREQGMRRGTNRMAFDHESALWMGKTHRQRGWAGSSGIQRLRWTGRVPMEVQHIALTENGFNVTFTQRVDADALDSDELSIERYYYRYDQAYGSPQLGSRRVAIADMQVSSDGHTLHLALAELVPGYMYEMNLAHVRSESGHNVLSPRPVYSLQRLHDGTTRRNYVPDVATNNGVFDAAEASLRGRIGVSSNHAGHTGNGFANFSTDNSESSIVWQVRVPEPGDYELQFRYALAEGNRPLELLINGESVESSMDFPATSGWSRWETVSFRVELAAGVQTIELAQIGIRGANIDQLRIIPLR